MTTTNLPRRLLGVWAHPDDEAYLSSGLMHRVVRAGGSVTLFTATDGELGFTDEDQRGRAERVLLRRSELRAAMGHLGVDDIRLGGWGDGTLAEVPTSLVARRISQLIAEVRPDMIVTFGPDGITGHDDHVATSVATTLAWQAMGTGTLLYATKTTAWLGEFRELNDQLGVWMTSEPPGRDAADVALDVSLDTAEVELKRRVLAGHASQTAGLAEAMGEQTYRRWYDNESFRCPDFHELFAAQAA